MRTTRGMAIAAVSALAASGAVVGVTGAAASPTATDVSDSTAPLRFATFNASLNRERPGPAPSPTCPHPPTRRPVRSPRSSSGPGRMSLLINEFDFDRAAARRRCSRTTTSSVGHNGAPPIHYPYRVHRAVSNTGVASGFDLNNDGRVVTQPGAPGTATTRSASVPSPVSSAWPCTPATRSTADRVRTFQRFLWKDMPGALLPDDPATPAPADWYSPEELGRLPAVVARRHWDLPDPGRAIAPCTSSLSHPTPPVFDGPEDRNGRRNFDEIRFWADYVRPGARPRTSTTTTGTSRRPAARVAAFVIAGDQNSRPVRRRHAFPARIQQLLEPSRGSTTRSPRRAAGAVEASALQGGANATPPRQPGPRHRRLRRRAGARQPARRLRAALASACGVSGGGGVLASVEPTRSPG